MPRPQRDTGDFRVQSDFVEADVAAGFTLLTLAENQPDAAGEALEQAERAYLDAQRRLSPLNVYQTRILGPKLASLRSAIDFYSIVLAR